MSIATPLLNAPARNYSKTGRSYLSKMLKAMELHESALDRLEQNIRVEKLVIKWYALGQLSLAEIVRRLADREDPSYMRSLDQVKYIIEVWKAER
jgi:hypothetical protein